MKRGDIYYADLSPVVGSEQGGVRPVLIVQNDTGNRYSPTVIAAAITSQTNKAKLPTPIALSAPDYGLPRDSVVLLEQIRTLDKRRLRERMGRVDGELMERIDAAIARTRAFFESLGVKTRLSDYGIGADAIDRIVAQLEAHGMTALGEHGDIDLATSRRILEASL